MCLNTLKKINTLEPPYKMIYYKIVSDTRGLNMDVKRVGSKQKLYRLYRKMTIVWSFFYTFLFGYKNI